jgi:hypothetical protein
MYPIGAKLEVKEFFYTHVGTYIGNGLVFHNHWKNDYEVIPHQQFANGKSITVTEGGVSDIHALLNRVQYALDNPRPYNFLNNNCEHATSYVRNGAASSPQVAFWGAVALLVVGTYALSKTAKA